MSRPIILAPSILSADHARLAEEISLVEKAGGDWIHVDVMDGLFVSNLTLGPPVIASLRKVTELPLDVHLMIQEPERSLQQYVDAGANRVTVHVEASTHLHRTLSQIRDAGAQPGVALNPSTPVIQISHVLHLVDLVLIMTVNPGFGGQRFIVEMVPKVEELRELLEAKGVAPHIQVDGGIDPTTISQVAQAGANVFVAGAAVFGSSDYAETLRALREAAS